MIVALLAAALTAGCASVNPTDPPRVVAFGDSLTDLGTYVARTEGKTAGRFTTNPGPIWIERVATAMGATITANRHAGFGKAPVVLGGTGYGEGGSRVALQPGSGNTDATAGPGSAQTTLPVRDQITAYLATTNGRFGARDTVFVWAGPNDLFRQAFFAPAATDAANEALVRQAGKDLVAEVRRIVSAGAQQVIVLNMDDYGEAPGPRASPKHALISAWVQAFNDELAAGLAGQPVVLVDAHALLRSARNEPERFGLKNGSTPACDVAKLPQRAVVFCDQGTLVEKDAHLTHLYADGVHPSTAGHRLIADFVLERMKVGAPRR